MGLKDLELDAETSFFWSQWRSYAQDLYPTSFQVMVAISSRGPHGLSHSHLLRSRYKDFKHFFSKKRLWVSSKCTIPRIKMVPSIHALTTCLSFLLKGLFGYLDTTPSLLIDLFWWSGRGKKKVNEIMFSKQNIQASPRFTYFFWWKILEHFRNLLCMIQIQSGLWSCEMEVVCAAWGALPIAAISAETSFAVGQEVNCWEMKLRYDGLVAALLWDYWETMKQKRVLRAIQHPPFLQTFNFLLKIYIFNSFNEGCPRGQEIPNWHGQAGLYIKELLAMCWHSGFGGRRSGGSHSLQTFHSTLRPALIERQQAQNCPFKVNKSSVTVPNFIFQLNLFEERNHIFRFIKLNFLLAAPYDWIAHVRKWVLICPKTLLMELAPKDLTEAVLMSGQFFS